MDAAVSLYGIQMCASVVKEITYAVSYRSRGNAHYRLIKYVNRDTLTVNARKILFFKLIS